MKEELELRIHGEKYFNGSFSYPLKKGSTLVFLEDKIPFINEFIEETKRGEEVVLCKSDLPLSSSSLAFSSDYPLYPNLSVKDNLLTLLKGSKKEVEIALKKLANEYELSSYLDKKAKDLPEVITIRLLFAKLFSSPREVIVFASSFKRLSSSSIKELLRLVKKANASFIYLTKNVYEAMVIADSLVTNPFSGDEEKGDPLSLLSDPKKKKTLEAIYSSKLNIIPFHHEDKGIKLLNRLWPLESEIDGFFLIHQKEVRLSPNGEYAGKVLFVEQGIIHVQCALNEVKIETNDVSLSVGQEVHFSFDLSKGYYFTNKGERILLNLMKENNHEKSS